MEIINIHRINTSKKERSSCQAGSLKFHYSIYDDKKIYVFFTRTIERLVVMAYLSGSNELNVFFLKHENSIYLSIEFKLNSIIKFNYSKNWFQTCKIRNATCMSQSSFTNKTKLICKDIKMEFCESTITFCSLLVELHQVGDNFRHAYNLRIKRKDERLTTVVVEHFLTPN